MSSHLERLGDRISVPLLTDDQGYSGRECPKEECRRYFKVKPATGLVGDACPCYCAYCGQKGEYDDFFTAEQIEYARSVAFCQILEALDADLKRMECDIPAQGPFGIGISVKVTSDPPPPIRYYREKQLETEVICVNCSLQYTIYGVFAFCPDCGAHNSRQILDKNFELVEKALALAVKIEGDLAEHLVGDALENAVSAFDGFGRELCRVHAVHATNSAQAQSVSFQNLAGAQSKVGNLFGFDMAAGMDIGDWTFAMRCFQKRHLLAHSMGVIDEKYISSTGDPDAVVGRKVVICTDEVSRLVALLKTLGTSLAGGMAVAST